MEAISRRVFDKVGHGFVLLLEDRYFTGANPALVAAGEGVVNIDQVSLPDVGTGTVDLEDQGHELNVLAAGSIAGLDLHTKDLDVHDVRRRLLHPFISGGGKLRVDRKKA